MIEKLKRPVKIGGTTFREKINELVDAINKLETMAKNTNTVLESLVQENNIHEKQIDELQMKLEPEKCEMRQNATISKMEKVEKPAENVQSDAESRPENVLKWIHGEDDEVQRYGSVARGFKSLRKEPADPYAEQRKWIGCLCRFWDDGCASNYISLLKQIDDDDTPFADDKGVYWEHCEPVKPDSEIIYHGE